VNGYGSEPTNLMKIYPAYGYGSEPINLMKIIRLRYAAEFIMLCKCNTDFSPVLPYRYR
jgi:hypothetical protein